MAVGTEFMIFMVESARFLVLFLTIQKVKEQGSKSLWKERGDPLLKYFAENLRQKAFTNSICFGTDGSFAAEGGRGVKRQHFERPVFSMWSMPELSGTWTIHRTRSSRHCLQHQDSTATNVETHKADESSCHQGCPLSDKQSEVGLEVTVSTARLHEASFRWQFFTSLCGRPTHWMCGHLIIQCDQKIYVYVDADFAASETMLRSTSGVAEFFGRSPIEFGSSTQCVRALSTGETEFYAITKGSAHTEWQSKQLSFLTRVVESGSHKGKSLGVWNISKSSGSRCIREALRLRKHPTETNIADLAPKYLSKHRMEIPLTECNLVLIKGGEGMMSTSWWFLGSERHDGSLVQDIVMDSEVKMFLFIRRVFFCMGCVLTKLLYVTELNNLLHCAIDDWFVNDRLAMGGWRSLEMDGTMGSHDANEIWNGGMASGTQWLMCSVNSTSAISFRWQTACLRCASRWDFDRRRNRHDCWLPESEQRQHVYTWEAFTDSAMLSEIQSCTWGVQTDRKTGKESSCKLASHRTTVGGYIHRTRYCIAYEVHTDGHSLRQKRQICCWSFLLSLSAGSHHNEDACWRSSVCYLLLWVILAYMYVKLQMRSCVCHRVGPFWVHFGSILGPFWVHFGSISEHVDYCLNIDASLWLGFKV